MDEYWEESRPKEEYIWKSTGLYAKAGTVVEVKVPDELVNKSQVQCVSRIWASSTWLKFEGSVLGSSQFLPLQKI